MSSSSSASAPSASPEQMELMSVEPTEHEHEHEASLTNGINGSRTNHRTNVDDGDITMVTPLDDLISTTGPETIPTGSDADIGRRILVSSSPQGTSNSSSRSSSGLSCLGIVVGYKGMTEARTSPGPIVEGEIGDEIEVLHRARHYEKWTVCMGSGLCQEMSVAEFTHGLQLYQHALQSNELRNSLGS
jgi:hypothetical protein